MTVCDLTVIVIPVLYIPTCLVTYQVTRYGKTEPWIRAYKAMGAPPRIFSGGRIAGSVANRGAFDMLVDSEN